MMPRQQVVVRPRGELVVVCDEEKGLVLGFGFGFWSAWFLVRRVALDSRVDSVHDFGFGGFGRRLT